MLAAMQKANDTLYDQDIHLFHGTDYIVEAMGDLRFHINAKSFYQTNSKQAIGLYDIVKDFAGLTGGQGVYDLYTGTGTIAQYIAGQAKWVVGIEAVPEAIEAAIAAGQDPEAAAAAAIQAAVEAQHALEDAQAASAEAEAEAEAAEAGEGAIGAPADSADAADEEA